MGHQPPDGDTTDAAAFIRRHAGEREPDLTSAQRDLLGRVIARRIERGAKIELIARAVAGALPELGAERARRLGRDETLRARAWEDLARLRADGVTEIALSAARNACPACHAASESTRSMESASTPPAIPVAGCTHPAGCRCRYVAASEASPVTHPEESADASSTSLIAEEGPEEGPEERSTRPWYRPHPPRPHGPRWTAAERAARRTPAPPARRPPHKRPPR